MKTLRHAPIKGDQSCDAMPIGFDAFMARKKSTC